MPKLLSNRMNVLPRKFTHFRGKKFEGFGRGAGKFDCLQLPTVFRPVDDLIASKLNYFGHEMARQGYLKLLVPGACQLRGEAEGALG